MRHRLPRFGISCAVKRGYGLIKDETGKCLEVIAGTLLVPKGCGI
jgi:hypothetical protein